MVNDLVKKFISVIENICWKQKPIIITYGSNILGNNYADLDVCIIVENSQIHAKKIVEESKKFFEIEGLIIDEEIPYENKLLYSYEEVDEILKDNIFINEMGEFSVLDIVKSEEFLKSKHMHERLLLNILTTLHKVVKGDELYVKLCEKRAWEIVIEAVTYCFKIPYNANPRNYMDILHKNPKTKKEGEWYLGYKSDGGVKDQYLLTKLEEFLPLFREKKINLAENVNPYYPTISMQRKIFDMTEKILKYPENKDVSMRENLSGVYGISQANIMITNGAMEAIQIVVNGVIRENVVIIQPTFWGYEDRLRKLNRCYNELWTEEDDLEEVLEKACARYKYVFLCNPNNPCYRYVSKSFIKSLLKKFKECTLIIDESLLAFESDYMDKTLVKEVIYYKNLIVLMSFSKISSFCGVRVGFLIAHKEIVSRLECYRAPYASSVLGQMILNEFGNNILCDIHNRNSIKKNFLILEKKISQQDKLTVKLCGNAYILLEVEKEIDVTDLCEYLHKSCIEVRNLVTAYPRIDKNWIRISAGKQSDFIRLEQKLDEYLRRNDDEK